MAKESDILRDVRVIIGENESLDALIEENDDMALERDTLLRTLIAPAIDKIHKLATAEMLRDVTEKAESLEWKEDDAYCQYCKLDNDMLFVTYVYVDGWDRPVTSFVKDYNQEYDMMRSPIAGVRPTEIYPACAILPDSEGGMMLMAYPKKKGSKRTVRYVPKASAETEGSDAVWSVSESCYWAAIYTIASLYYKSTDNSQRAKEMEQEAADRIKI